MARCTAHSSRTGKPCTKYAMKGQAVCDSHGGRSPQARKAAKERTERAKALEAIATYGLPVEVDPHTALLEELWRTAGHVAWLRLRIGELSDDQLHGPVGAAGESSFPREEPHVWVRLYQEERRHFHAVSRDCIRAGIEERRVTLAERQGALLAQVIRGVLSDLGIEDGPKVQGVVRKHLTLVAGGA